MDAQRVGDLMKQLSLAAVMEAIPMKLARQTLKETGKGSQRERLLPAHLVVYLVILLAFFAEVSVRENLRLLLEMLRRRFGLEARRPAADSAVTKARKRLGREPFVHLFSQVARPLGDETLPGCCWQGLRLVAADGTRVEVQHTSENIGRFGIHENQHGQVGYPALMAVVLLECGTRVPLGAATGGEHDAEGTLFDALRERLAKDMLLLLDRGLYSFERFKDCAQRCGALLWRIRSNIEPRVIEQLSDGSALVELSPSQKLYQDGRCQKDERLTARLIEYQAVFADGTTGERARLLTTLLDPHQAPAEELARLYAERWQAETGFDELKTHLRGPQRVLRSPLPDLVEQEFFGFLLAYYVVRATMVEAARKSGTPPTELSFVHAVRVIRRKLAFPPSKPEGGQARV
jgi:hypothetical protein